MTYSEEKDVWTDKDVDELFQKKNETLSILEKKKFSDTAFAYFLKQIQSTSTTTIALNKEILSKEQINQLLKVVSSNTRKGLRIVTENGDPLGPIYTNWHPYFKEKNKLSLEMHETTLKALNYLNKKPCNVIDFGSGVGQDTLHLLKNEEFYITAIDGDEEALKLLKEQITDESQKKRLTPYTGPFIYFESSKKFDLFLANFTFPYRPKEDFNACFEKTVSLIEQEGLLAAHFFSPPKQQDPGMTYHNEEEVRTLLEKNFDLLWFYKETRDDGRKVFGGDEPPWGDLFHIVGRKK
jgi:SAM-dependent methyltransferase